MVKIKLQRPPEIYGPMEVDGPMPSPEVRAVLPIVREIRGDGALATSRPEVLHITFTNRFAQQFKGGMSAEIRDRLTSRKNEIQKHHGMGLVPAGRTGNYYRIDGNQYQHLHFYAGHQRIYCAYSKTLNRLIFTAYLDKKETADNPKFFDKSLPDIVESGILTDAEAESFITQHNLNFRATSQQDNQVVNIVPLSIEVEALMTKIISLDNASELARSLPYADKLTESALILLNQIAGDLCPIATRMEQLGLVSKEQHYLTINFLSTLKVIQTKLLALMKAELQKAQPDWEALSQLWDKWNYFEFKAQVRNRIKAMVDQKKINGEDMRKFKQPFDSIGELGQIIIEIIEVAECRKETEELCEATNEERGGEGQQETTGYFKLPEKKSDKLSAGSARQQLLAKVGRFDATIAQLKEAIAKNDPKGNIGVVVVGNHGLALSQAKQPAKKRYIPGPSDKIGLIVSASCDDYSKFVSRLSDDLSKLGDFPETAFVNFEPIAPQKRVSAKALSETLHGLIRKLMAKGVRNDMEKMDLYELYPANNGLSNGEVIDLLKVFTKREKSSGIGLVALLGRYAQGERGENLTEKTIIDQQYETMIILIYGYNYQANKYKNRLEQYLKKLNFPQHIICVNQMGKPESRMRAVVYEIFEKETRRWIRGRFSGIYKMVTDGLSAKEESLLGTLPYIVLFEAAKKYR